jgi:hypothetical protein
MDDEALDSLTPKWVHESEDISGLTIMSPPGALYDNQLNVVLII